MNASLVEARGADVEAAASALERAALLGQKGAADVTGAAVDGVVLRVRESVLVEGGPRRLGLADEGRHLGGGGRRELLPHDVPPSVVREDAVRPHHRLAFSAFEHAHAGRAGRSVVADDAASERRVALHFYGDAPFGVAPQLAALQQASRAFITDRHPRRPPVMYPAAAETRGTTLKAM